MKSAEVLTGPNAKAAYSYTEAKISLQLVLLQGDCQNRLTHARRLSMKIVVVPLVFFIFLLVLT